VGKTGQKDAKHIWVFFKQSDKCYTNKAQFIKATQ